MYTIKLLMIYLMMCSMNPSLEEVGSPTQTQFGNFDATVLENGKQQVIVNTTGHNPKDIKVDVTDTEIKITSKKGENTSRFVSDIDLTLTVGKDYDGTKTEAKFENGLLTLLIDKKEDKKNKIIKFLIN